MKTQWMVESRGDPLGAVRGFLKTLWMSAELDGMIVPAIGKQPGQTLPDILTSPSELDQFNPFRPLMEANATKYLPDLLRRNPEGHFGVVLRPCEMRALIEMVKRDALALERLLTICIDCLSTYPAEEYEWRASRKGSSQVLTREACVLPTWAGSWPTATARHARCAPLPEPVAPTSTSAFWGYRSASIS